MMAALLRLLLRHLPPREIITLALLASAIACLVNGLGAAVRGATWSVFLPAGLLAALLGWGFASSRFNGWLTSAGIFLVGGILIWVGTAKLSGWMFQEVTSTFTLIIAYLYHLRGGPTPDLLPLYQTL